MCADESVDLVVTSPPYPMFEMWDEVFCGMNPSIEQALSNTDGRLAFTLMHDELKSVWSEVVRVLKNGGWACINIGDATRKVGDYFQLYSNHSRITMDFFQLGLDVLPVILWRKQTNAPNKFMGSGMYPGGAYVTLEHEYILIFRKGHRREFMNGPEKQNRHASSYFWEERNQWFSDTWDFKGVRQGMARKASRERSAAYPFELAYRLVHMYSVYGDTVLDPFVGTGTTSMAAMAAGRHSISMEIDTELANPMASNLSEIIEPANQRIEKRLADHRDFIKRYKEDGREPKHFNTHHDVPVVTSQETELKLQYLTEIVRDTETSLTARYGDERPILLPLFQDG